LSYTDIKWINRVRGDLVSSKLFLSSVVLLVLASFLFVGSVGASSTMWSQTYGSGGAHSLVEASDGGYAIAGYRPDTFGHDDFWLIKTDGSGNMEWNRTYGGEWSEEAYSLVVTSDGGYALAGTTSGSRDHQSYTDALLVKTDAYGNMEWSQTYGGAGDQQAFSLVETSDNRFALAGYTTSVYAGPADCWLVKTDEYGNIPEFPSWTSVLIMLLAVMAVTVIYRSRFHSKQKKEVK